MNILRIGKARIYTMIALVLLALTATGAMADETKYEIQYLLLDTKTPGAGYQPSALLYKHIVPYNKLIQFEGVVALGLTEESETRRTGIAGTFTQKLKLSNMLGILAKITGEIEPKVHGYIHFGLTRLDFDFSTPASSGGPDGSQSATGLAYGLGITFSILRKGAFVLEFNQLPDLDTNGETYKSSYIGLGYQMPF